ncbi:MAG: hypothetical protein AAF335_01090 [Bacteroidota bacterium]
MLKVKNKKLFMSMIKNIKDCNFPKMDVIFYDLGVLGQSFVAYTGDIFFPREAKMIRDHEKDPKKIIDINLDDKLKKGEIMLLRNLRDHEKGLIEKLGHKKTAFFFPENNLKGMFKKTLLAGLNAGLNSDYNTCFYYLTNKNKNKEVNYFDFFVKESLRKHFVQYKILGVLYLRLKPLAK